MSKPVNTNAVEQKLPVENKKEEDNNTNYCTFRTINVPRDSYNDQIMNYQLLQDAYVHETARKELDKSVNGHVGCLGCSHTLPICPTESGINFSQRVNDESKLLGI
jgi:hypothetical protein